MGYSRPAEDKVTVHVVYSSQLLRMPPGTLREMVVASTPIPGRPTGMALFGCEDDTWMFTAFGMAGREPPAEPADRLAFVEAITPPHVMDALRNAEPLSEICRYRYPENRWRRYDKMKRFPAGLLVIGDAVANFNPIYGQGMTVAALQAVALRRLPVSRRERSGPPLLPRGGETDRRGVAVRHRCRSQPARGRRPPIAVDASRQLLRRPAADRCESDNAVAEQLIRVTGLIDPPTRLFRPKVMYRAARARRPR